MTYFEFFEVFKNFSNNELANYYVDICSYADSSLNNTFESADLRSKIRDMIVDRFINQYADNNVDIE